MLVVRVTNPCDPDRPRHKRAGFGLSLVRQRLQSQFGLAGQLDIDEQRGEFTAKVSLPFEPPRGRTRMLEPKPLTVVIVDDEAPARALIREYLEQHADVHVVAECTNGLEAVKAANELKPDLLFLDIQMPKLDGFEVLDLIGRDAAGVVFTTAYDDYALRAFEVHAVDYLLKPFGPERFAESLKLARSRISQREPIPARELLETHREGTAIDRLLIRDRSHVHVILWSKSITLKRRTTTYRSARAGAAT